MKKLLEKMNFVAPIYINRRGVFCFIYTITAITLINFGLAYYWLNIACQENLNTLKPPNRYSPLIFIGGFPRSGTTLMRSILDSHPAVRCGLETRIIPRLLSYRHKDLQSQFPLREIPQNIFDNAFAELLLEIIAKHDYPAARLCNKDPLALLHGQYTTEIFPNAKFLFMIRDARAVVHSFITRKIKMPTMDLNDFGSCFKEWNKRISHMNNECDKIGKEKCLKVYYEQLVLKPKIWIKKITNFLNLTWFDSLLHHEKFVNKIGGVNLSNLERSTDQVVKPIYVDALTSWIGHIPTNVLSNLTQLAPMLMNFGYDITSSKPDYSKLKIVNE